MWLESEFKHILGESILCLYTHMCPDMSMFLFINTSVSEGGVLMCV